MELDDLKQVWQEYDKKLEKSLNVNEELIRTMKLKMVSDQFRPLRNFEIVNLVGCILFGAIIFQLTCIYRGINEILICGIIAVLLFLYSLYYSIKALQLLYRVDDPSNSVSEMQHSIGKYEIWYQSNKKISLFLFPFLVLTVVPIAIKWVHNVNVFENLQHFYFPTAMAIIVGFILLLFIYKGYEKKIKKGKEYLHQIETFSQEEN